MIIAPLCKLHEPKKDGVVSVSYTHLIPGSYYQKPDQQADKDSGISPKKERHATIGCLLYTSQVW